MFERIETETALASSVAERFLRKKQRLRIRRPLEPPRSGNVRWSVTEYQSQYLIVMSHIVNTLEKISGRV
jgi:hypothetical protein